MSSFLPSREAQLAPYLQNMSAKISAAPTTYGLVAADATALATLVTAFVSALATATNPTTRTKGTIAAKDTAKAQVVATVRVLAKRIQANPAVTAQMKTDLGLPVHAVVPTPQPPPTSSPALIIVSIKPRAHIIRIADENTPNKRARPKGTFGAEVYSYVGDPADAPADLELWRFEGQATKAEFEVDYGGADVGKTALIVARWYNRKGETGPVSLPVNATVAGSAAQAAAANAKITPPTSGEQQPKLAA